MTAQRTVFIDSNLNDFEALAGLYDTSTYTVVQVSGGYQAIQDYLSSNAISAEDINVVSASGSQNGVFNPRVVFVDPGVANYQQLIADMPANATIVVLDASRDGVQQIHDYLAANTGLVEAIDIVADIASLDVVSHGGAGEITLGSTVLTSANLADYEAELAAIGDMLTESGDILIYGCDVAAGAEGQQFIQELAAVTGADVAASTDLTGSASAGGDWDLEASTGTIETAVISDPAYGEVLVNSSITAISTTSIAADTGSSSTDFITSDTTITFAGSVSASVGSSPQSFYVWLVPQTGTAVCLNPSLAIASTAGSTISWNLSYAPALAQGNYTIKFSTSNNISNYESKLLGTERSLTIDTGTAVPSVALTNDTGPSNTDKITSDGSLTITGQEAGATLSYSVNGGGFTSSFTAVDGVNTVIVRSTDVAGNFADTNFNFTLDTIVDASTDAAIVELANDSGSSNSDKITRFGTLSITGQEAGATTSYSIDGGTTFTGSFAAVEGVNNVIVRSTDGVGNTADTAFNFTLDTGTAAPSVALVTDTGSSNSDKITNVGTLAITGQEASATTSYSIDGGLNFTNSFSAVEGANNVVVRSTDVAGNYADTTFNFTLDTDADLGDDLAVTINDVDGFINNAEKAAVSFTVAGLDADAKATVTFTDSASNTVVVPNLDNGTMSADLSSLLDGPITASISALDIAGNPASGTGDSSTKDTTTPAPVVALATDSGADTGDKITNVGTLAITGQEPGATTSYSVDGGSTFTNSFSAVEGANNVIVRSTDVAGNYADTAFNFTLDTDADLDDNLTVTINDVDGFINNAEMTAVSFTVAGLDADAKATVTFTDSASNTVVVPNLDNGTMLADLSSLLDGPITASISALDVAGNPASGTGDSSTKDTTTPAPVVALVTDSGADTGDEITNVGTLAITGQEPGATTSYSIDGGSSFTNSFTAVEGVNNVIVRSTDVAGNEADTAFSFTLDTDGDLGDNLAVTINDVDGFINNAEKTAVSFTVAGLDADAKATVTFTDSASNTVVVPNLDNGTMSADLSGLLDGAITASISALDIAGNEASGTGDSSTKDTTTPAPVVALTTDSGADTDDEITNVGTLAITGQEPGATTSYSIDGGSTFTNSFSAVEGANNVIVRSTDVAGNYADTTFNFTLDTDADLGDDLAVTINDVDGFINNAEKTAVSFTVAGLDADAKATVTFTDSANTTVVVGDLSNGATTADLSGLLDGPITASVSALDIAGNTSSGASDSSTKDTIAPIASAIPLAVVENAPILLPLVQDWLIDNINQSQIQIGTIQYAWASGSSSTALIDPVSKQPVALSTLGGKVTWSSDGKSLLIQTDAKLDWMTSGQQITATINYTVQDGAGNTTTQPIILNIMGSSTDGKDKVLNGTNGVDKWTGADGTDYGQGGNGNDILSGMAGNDALYGGNGNDDINGGTGTDYLYGDSGNDVIRGGDGNDVIFGGMNNDTLYGDAGNDHFVYMPKFNNDKIMDFVKGTDTLHLIGLTPPGMTASQFVANHVQDVGNDLLISIGGNTITLVGVADTSGLASSISFVMPQ